MYDFLTKEIHRQEHMDMRYKSLDEEQYKQDDSEAPKHDSTDDTELKYFEQNFNEFRSKLFEDLGLMINDEVSVIAPDEKNNE